MPNSIAVFSSGASALGVRDWVKSQSYVRQSDGYLIEVYNGPKTSLSAFVAAVKRTYPSNYTEIAESVSDGGSATVTISVGDENTGEGGTPEATDDVKDLDYQITPYIEEVPIECNPEFDALTAEQVAEVKALVDAADTEEIAKLTGKQATLAYWLMMGVTTYKMPCFQVSVTRYMKLKSVLPGDIYTGCGEVTTSILNVPVEALPEGEWEYLKLSPTVTPEQKWLRCAYEYLGAKRWPNFYKGGSWTPEGASTPGGAS